MRFAVIAAVCVVAFLLIITVASAAMLIPANDKAKDNAKAPENSPVIEDNWDLTRVDFIHYVKPPNVGEGLKGKRATS